MGFHGYTTEGGWRIPFAALRWSYAAPGGPGGQHANKTASKATVRVEIVDLGLDPAQSATLRQRFGGTIQAYASDSRSQAENKEACLRKLGERIDAALERQPKRVGTRPSARARQKRVEGKRRRGDTKRLRRQLEEE